MQRNLLALMMMMICCAAVSVAQQQDYKLARNRTSAVDFFVSNYGIFGHNVSMNDPGLFYPRGSGNTYLYGSGIWFGALKNLNDTLRPLTLIGYNMNSGVSWATPGESSSTTSDKGLYYAGDHDRASGAYAGAGFGATWPLWAATGAGVTPRNPGVYVADVAARTSGGGLDRPAFMPNVAEQFVTRFHDGDLSRYEGFGSSFGFPMGLQFQQSVYSFSVGSRYESVVILQYEVINVSEDTLFDCVIGQASDPDLGLPNNDRAVAYRGTDGRTRAGITTTAAEPGRLYEALAQILLEAPSIGDDGFVDNSLRQAQLERHEIHTWRAWSLESDPVTLVERYEFMSGPALDSDASEGDKRTMLATRAFDMAPGDTAHFSMAFAIVPSPFGLARGDDDERDGVAASPTMIDELIASLVADYIEGVFRPYATSAVGTDATIAATMSVAPNPTANGAAVSFSLSQGGTVEVSIVNAMGERVSRTSLGRLDAGAHRATLDLGGLPNGTYVVAVDADGGRRSAVLTVVR